MSEVERLYHEILMSRSGEERLRMGAEMYSAARVIALSAKPSGETTEEWILRRFYGSELTEGEIRSFLTKLRERRR
jgi:hypothetical protein